MTTESELTRITNSIDALVRQSGETATEIALLKQDLRSIRDNITALSSLLGSASDAHSIFTRVALLENNALDCRQEAEENKKAFEDFKASGASTKLTLWVAFISMLGSFAAAGIEFFLHH